MVEDICFIFQCVFTGGSVLPSSILFTTLSPLCPFPHQGEVALRRGDVTGDNAVLYLAEVTSKTACIKFQCEIKFEVENRKPLAVTIYDYYMPSELTSEGGGEGWSEVIKGEDHRGRSTICAVLYVRITKCYFTHSSPQH